MKKQTSLLGTASIAALTGLAMPAHAAEIDVYPRPTFAITQDLNITVTDSTQDSGSAQDFVNVQVTDASSGGDTETVQLMETPDDTGTGYNTGIFKGTVPTAALGVAGPGTLSGNDTLDTVDGHTVEVTYNGVAPPLTASTDAVLGTTGVLTVPAEIHIGDIMRIEVKDADRNTDPYKFDTFTVTSGCECGGDSEDAVVLTETGDPNSGIFVGFIPITDGSSVNNDGKLTVVVGDVIYTRYIDDFDNTGAKGGTVTAETTVTATTVTPPPSSTTDTTTNTSIGGGGCVAGTGTAWNITMPAILAALLGYGLVRRRRKQQ